ncbi:MAG: putative Asparagine synthetase 1, partial [Sphingomonas bacterium]|nr:putative Asparagine synthetase 1 [Sphingomonas bacterium]
CGIAGLYRPRSASLSPGLMGSAVRAMTDVLIHRGPDGDGLWTDPEGRCVLGHRRLSIIDTSDAGRQPMESGNGRYIVTFNGEIYNFVDLRQTLTAAGVVFKGRTDTEVLVEAFALWGVDALTRLDGMFALGIFDTLSGDLLLARDPFGEKPLYHSRLKGGGIVFGSELQALERAPGFDARISIDAMAEMLSFQYIGAPRSIYQSVRKLRPGSWMRVEQSGRVTSGSYFAFKPGEGGFTDRALPDLADELEELLAVSLRRRLVADVPLGAFLSGGVDSATVCALIARKLNRPLMTFSMGFENAPESEHLTAELFAAHLRTEHRTAIISPDVASFLSQIGSILDEPNGDSSCLPTYMLSKFAREHVTVAMSGDGGDELFAGYGRYFSAMGGQARHRAGEDPSWSAGRAYYGSSILVAGDSEIEKLFGTIPRGFADHLGLLRMQVDERSEQLLCELRRTDAENYMPGAVLPKVDRMSMQQSLEVRTPFLSVEVARFAERLPDSVLVGERGKLVLREIAYRYLPRELIDLPKQGFALPMSGWARASLLEAAQNLLGGTDSRLRAAIGSEGVAHFLERQSTVDQFSPYQVWGVVALESWMRHHPVELEHDSGEHGGHIVTPPPSQPPSFVLRATPVSAGLFLVARTDSSAPVERSVRSTDPDLMIRAVELSAPVPAGANEAPIDLPDWGSERGDATGLDRFAGATLIFVDTEASLRFGAEECASFQALGVARILFRRAFGVPGVLELEFRHRKGWRRVLDLARLLRRRAVVVSRNPWVRLLPSTRKFVATDGKAWQTGVLRAVDAIPDQELSSRFMAFEGLRQLPPVVAGHAVIAEEGDGRYSVFDQALRVAPTRRGSGKASTYWLVRSGEDTRPYLPITAREDDLQRLGNEDLSRLFQAGGEHSAEDFALRPGDPVVVCTHALPPGGAERQWVYLAQALHEAGYDVTFVVYHPIEGENAHYLSALTDAGIPVLEASRIPLADQIALWPKTPAALRLVRSQLIPDSDKLFALVAAFARVRPKVVFSQLDEPNLFTAFAAEVTGVPLHIMSFRNYNPTNFSYLNKDWYEPAYRLLTARPGTVASGNHRDANRDYADWIGIAADSVHYVPNVIDPASFPAADPGAIARVRAEFGVDSDTPIILGALRLSAEKDPIKFVEVCAAALEMVPGSIALIAGVGPLEPLVRERIEELGMADRILLLGRRSDVNLLMRIASVCLLTSRMEGMPNVLMEAQLLGVPVVATAVGGVPDVLIDQVTAYLYPPADVRGMAGACAELMRNPARAREMGAAGRAHVLSAFPKAALVDKYRAIIANWAATRSAARRTP